MNLAAVNVKAASRSARSKFMDGLFEVRNGEYETVFLGLYFCTFFYIFHILCTVQCLHRNAVSFQTVSCSCSNTVYTFAVCLLYIYRLKFSGRKVPGDVVFKVESLNAADVNAGQLECRRQ